MAECIIILLCGYTVFIDQDYKSNINIMHNY